MKRERHKDLVGKRVRLLRDIETKGGVKFEAGLEMVVTGTYRGTYGLFRGDRPNGQRGIHKVGRANFEVIEDLTPPPLP